MEGRSQRRGWLGKLFMSSCQLLVEMSQKSYIRDEKEERQDQRCCSVGSSPYLKSKEAQ